MEQKYNSLLAFVLNESRHLDRYLEGITPYRSAKQCPKVLGKPLLRGSFFSYSKPLKQFQPFYFQLYPGCMLRYQDQTQSPPMEVLLCQQLTVFQQNEEFGDSISFGIILQNEREITKLATDQLPVFQVWYKNLRQLCRLTNFSNRFQVESQIFQNYYLCFDQKQKEYSTAQILAKKSLKPDQRDVVENEIVILRKIVNPLFPQLQKVFDDDQYIYMVFDHFSGEDMYQISSANQLEEVAIATIVYHILKALKVLHNQGYFHGNIQLQNIIFSTQMKENQLFLLNMRYTQNVTLTYLLRSIAKGTNTYAAPQMLSLQPIDSQIDLFSLGACLYYMVFKTFPYYIIEQNQENDAFKYVMDLSLLESTIDKQKQNPSAKTVLSASGFDFLFKLLEEKPDKRLTAKQALSHHWFINFTNHAPKNKKGKIKQMEENLSSLRTIMECSEIDETPINTEQKQKRQEELVQEFQQIENLRMNILLSNQEIEDEEISVDSMMKSLTKQSVKARLISHLTNHCITIEAPCLMKQNSLKPDENQIKRSQSLESHKQYTSSSRKIAQI